MKHWFAYNLRCWRGRRCANLQTTTLEGNPPPGALIVLLYTCTACKTKYIGRTLVGNGGSFTQLPREIQTSEFEVPEGMYLALDKRL